LVISSLAPTPAAEIAALGTAAIVLAAEWLHARRCRRLAPLAFGPHRRPSTWARLAPLIRAGAASALVWGFVSLLLLPPKTHQAQALPDSQRRNLMLVLDVSPSMKLKDAGPKREISRQKRGADVLGSFFSRVSIDTYLISVVACYNGAKPVVVGTKDMEVIGNILTDLPMQYAFLPGKTDLFSGLTEAAKIAQPWKPKSTLLVMLTDGDTVAPTGMPKMPDSVSDVLIVGVGDPKVGSFIDGRQSRQDSGTLRQIAARLHGTYHDANEKHIPTDLLRQLTFLPRKSFFEKLTRREYALLACGIGSSVLALLPVLLHHFGTRWRPGVPEGAENRQDLRRRNRVEAPVV
jgi:Ca-activated chloride channel homolog